MPNIKFNYLYRDAGNYKNYGSVVFANPNDLGLLEIETIIRAKLIDSMWFYANEWQVPDLHLMQYQWDNDLDHTFHEFGSVEFTDDMINTISPFFLN